MNTCATGTFGIKTQDEEPYDEREGVKLTRAHLTKTFQGDVEGESTTNLLFAYGTGEGSAAYVDLERFVGLIHGRSGSFVLRHSATMKRDEGRPHGPWYQTPVPVNSWA